jgi:hypothetical protein
MSPDLMDGARVTISPSRFYSPGDIVCFSGASGRLVLHRVIGYRPDRSGIKLWTQADSAPTPDSPVDFERVLGKVSRPVPLGRRALALGRFLRVAARRLLS